MNKERKFSIRFISVITISFILMMFGLGLIGGGCATFQEVKEPVKVEMVLLSELLFEGDISGVKVPAQFGDFSTTHDFYPTDGGDFWILEWIPMSENKQILFFLVVKVECPEAITLQIYAMDTKESTYWIYDSVGQAWQVDKEKYDFFLALDHPCVIDMPEGIDATLRI